MYENLPEPRLFVKDNMVWLMMEHDGKQAWERLPSHFLKGNDEQRRFLINNLKIVEKLFKKLGIKLGAEIDGKKLYKK